MMNAFRAKKKNQIGGAIEWKNHAMMEIYSIEVSLTTNLKLI